MSYVGQLGSRVPKICIEVEDSQTGLLLYVGKWMKSIPLAPAGRGYQVN